MNYLFKVPENKKIDLIIDSDAKNEADDQYAIVHGLISPKFNVLGIIASHFGKRRSNRSMMESYDECKKIVSLMEKTEVPIYKGNEEELISTDECALSEGAKFIIKEAQKAEKFVSIAVMGPLTNIAAALIHEPSIANKIKVVWVGGRTNELDNLCYEANARNDYLAVNVVMEKCENIIQIPAETYSKLQVSIAELEYKVNHCGEIGKYLFEQLIDFNYRINRPWLQGESWSFGDTSAISILLNNQSCTFTKRKAFILNSSFEVKEINKEIELVTDIDSRYALEDFFSKLSIFSKR